MKTVAIAGTFDSKGAEFAFIKKMFEAEGVKTLTINTGVFKPYFEPDVSNRVLFEAAGEDADAIIKKADRGIAVDAISRGLQKVLPELYKEKKFDGVISLGGSGGTSLVAPAMRTLPLGVPKIIVSTVASGNVEKYIETSDLVLIPSIVDVSGINDVSRMVFTNAVYAMIGMLSKPEDKGDRNSKPMIAASMFGVTTPCIDKAKEYLEKKGYEVLVFHATGVGGRTMERLISGGYFKGVLDLTTTEWCDELVGGELRAGRQRGEAASINKVPQVVSVGADDMVNFGPPDTVPDKFKGRKFYQHNPMVTLMRTTIEENKMIGDALTSKWNLADPSKIVVMLPKGGVSMLDSVNNTFWGLDEDNALFETIHKKLNPEVKIIDMDCNINDDDFALTAAKELLHLIETVN